MVLLIIGVAIAVYVSPSLVDASDGAPSIPHGTAGYEQCLTCHGTGGVKPIPSDHASFEEGSCLSCHSLSAEPSAEESLAENDYCLSCHGQPGLSMTFANGEKLPLYVDSGVFAASIHGDKLLCADCHSSITTYPHPEIEFSGQREYNVAQYELCKRCHFANYTKTLDSVHFQVLSSGNLNAPLCTDCHGAHNVGLPSHPEAKISQTCSDCHQNIYEVYADSVHGKALIGENNYDVPVCTDCHAAHTIEDPRTAAFRLESVELCSKCHGNKELMQKYGLSTNVVKSYLEDFHGRYVALIGAQGKDIPVREAVCTDCHGVHDIRSVDNPDSPVIKANLLETCRKCHPDATTNFPGAWLSHYEPSLTKAPLVFFADWFYRILIPFILVGLSIHILLDLWRRITNR
ncbi:cytochrome c3 family protein [Chloroflexota bacterium]